MFCVVKRKLDLLKAEFNKNPYGNSDNLFPFSFSVLVARRNPNRADIRYSKISFVFSAQVRIRDRKERIQRFAWEYPCRSTKAYELVQTCRTLADSRTKFRGHRVLRDFYFMSPTCIKRGTRLGASRLTFDKKT